MSTKHSTVHYESMSALFSVMHNDECNKGTCIFLLCPNDNLANQISYVVYYSNSSSRVYNIYFSHERLLVQ